ncbi:hypothetical protein ABPG72_019533 [Tetrahymena utriculariae]
MDLKESNSQKFSKNIKEKGGKVVFRHNKRSYCNCFYCKGDYLSPQMVDLKNIKQQLNRKIKYNSPNYDDLNF